MPIYEYQCTADACEHRFDKLHRSHTEPNPDCLVCGAIVRRLVSVPSFVLRGSGWASDGYGGGRTVDEVRRAINDVSRMKGVTDDQLANREAKSRGGSGD